MTGQGFKDIKDVQKNVMAALNVFPKRSSINVCNSDGIAGLIV
jgi:hypothetical protein